jgi:1,4-dihydroxy-2-naphthoate octaprenyltransferase
VNAWVAGARPRTLPAAIVPVLVGTGVASTTGAVIWWRAGAALIVALSLQIGTNYANDYADGIRGTDAVRVGPVRLVASGLATPTSVKRAALVAFAVGALAGLALTVAVGPQLAVVGAASIAAGWYYTGGRRRPYGYRGLGEVAVFVFFGLLATAGTAYVQTGHLTALAVGAAVPVGLLATALLVVNNLRDIPGDDAAGKRTLAVRIGDQQTRLLYVACVATALSSCVALAGWRIGALIALVAVPLAVDPIRRVRRGERGRDLIPVLGATGRVQLVFGVALAIGIALG